MSRPRHIETELRRLLRNYVERHRWSARQIRVPLASYVYGDCWDMSFELGCEIRARFPRLHLRMARGQGLQVALGSAPALRWGPGGQMVDGAELVQHYVLEWRGLILDPSAAQFGFRTLGTKRTFEGAWRRVTFMPWRSVEAMEAATARL